MRKLLNKRGQVLQQVSGVILGIMGLIFLVFAVLYAISALNPSSFFTAGSVEANATSAMRANLTTGVSNFAGYIPTVFTVLGVVFVLGGIFILILYIKRIQEGGTMSEGNL